MKNKKGLIGIIAAVVAVAVMAFVYTTFAPKAQEGTKNITIEVVSESQQVTTYEITTDAEYLEQAFAETEGLEITNEEGPYGMTIMAVNGEYGMYGASEQVVNDGDVFQIVFTKG